MKNNFIEIKKNKIKEGISWITNFFSDIIRLDKMIFTFFFFLLAVNMCHHEVIKTVSGTIGQSNDGNAFYLNIALLFFAYLIMAIKYFSMFIYANFQKVKKLSSSLKVLIDPKFIFFIFTSTFLMLIAFSLILNVAIPDNMLNANMKELVPIVEEKINKEGFLGITLMLISVFITPVLVFFIQTYVFFIYIIRETSINIFRSYQLAIIGISKNILPLFLIILFSSAVFSLNIMILNHNVNQYLLCFFNSIFAISLFDVWYNSAKGIFVKIEEI